MLQKLGFLPGFNKQVTETSADHYSYTPYILV
jgi:hypothetical protein